MEALDFYQPDLLTITPNNRLRDTVVSLAAEALMKQQRSNAVVAPKVSSITDYIQDSWLHLQSLNHPEAKQLALLSESALFFHWVSIIRNDNSLDTILNPTELASQAVAAEKRLALWCIDLIKPDSPESEIFGNWQAQFRQTTNGFVSTEQALKIITAAIENDFMDPPSRICAFSFDDLPPLYEKFFAALESKCQFSTSDFSKTTEATKYSVCNFDDAEQLVNMARWAYNHHVDDPNAQIAIVVPDLPAKRDAILDAMNEAFEPQVILPNTPKYTAPFNITAGTPLSSQPLIKVGLDLLKNGIQAAPLEDVLKVVKSPFIGQSLSERSQRAKFDIHLRKVGKTTLSILDLTGDMACPRHLSKAIGRFSNTIKNRAEKSSLAQWLKLFDESLKAIGWPGERNLNSEEFQAYKQFKSLLLELSGNFTFNSDLTIDNALFYLVTACNHTLYSAESKKTPIQIMGLLEAAGLTFDKMYILDMNMGIVPAKAIPNTFIPLQLQIDHKMPHADASRELEFFESIMDRYLHNCNELVFSYCQFQHESEMTPSYFVAGPEVSPEFFKAPPIDYQSYLINRIPVQTIYDEPVPLDTTRKSKGGVSILQKQALCPFSSFADNRLRVSEFPIARDGLSPPKRGQLLHDVMARIWQSLRSQEDLLALTDDEEHLVIRDAIDAAFVALRGREDLDATLVQMEKEQLQVIVAQWLEFDRKRPPFMVEAIEQERTVLLDKLEITIRVDRVDAVEDANRAFTAKVPIDYKSGSLKMKVAPEAFEDVQLPLSVLSENGKVVGVAYGGIKKNDIKMLGLSDGTDIGKGVVPVEKSKLKLPSTFKDTLQQWNDSLHNLASQYIAGEARITPSADACRYCKKSVLCRLNAA